MTEARLTVTDQTDGSTGLLGYLVSDEVWATLPGKRRDDGTVVLPFDNNNFFLSKPKLLKKIGGDQK
jgi:hypothetical protein